MIYLLILFTRTQVKCLLSKIPGNKLINYRRNFLNSALTILNKREREIFSARKLFDQPKKLEELSKKYNVSRERIRQIEEKAFNKVKKYIEIKQTNN